MNAKVLLNSHANTGMKSNPDFVLGGNDKASLHVVNGSLDADAVPTLIAMLAYTRVQAVFQILPLFQMLVKMRSSLITKWAFTIGSSNFTTFCCC